MIPLKVKCCGDIYTWVDTVSFGTYAYAVLVDKKGRVYCHHGVSSIVVIDEKLKWTDDNEWRDNNG